MVMDRIRNGQPITALELTALNFTFAMIRSYARSHMSAFHSPQCPRKSADWSFIDTFAAPDNMAPYPTRRYHPEHPLHRRKLALLQRFPSELWRPMELMYYPLGGVFIVAPRVSFMIGLNFQFSTPTQQLVWRLTASYHVFFCMYGALHWLYKDQKWYRAQKRLHGVV
ncbi:uncharacterized protein CLUP02_09715 [Colletotrichum lupini]|uniref:Uncharacterized protein n=1 Tax=Colletotrichum lupini TaxID=145971 RepID=A0A9Q8WI35_9PEZI|nr:uncharacterized protein CLUP02_09715 [Colletotrichum lupini]UQC84219.1 hypothetical protein CLUP02_09715 [Colletotrichum lupini]